VIIELIVRLAGDPGVTHCDTRRSDETTDDLLKLFVGFVFLLYILFHYYLKLIYL